ncbi:hypothetical protein FJZ26_01355 [Candidatus Parvarchaeota archaeon]|nr:hypothetical protein [Candidatus Parvarchaeota archaeon]
MKLSDRQKNSAVLILAALVLALSIYVFLPHLFYTSDFGARTTGKAFFESISNKSQLALVFDLSSVQAQSSYQDRLLQCGVGLAGSSGLNTFNKTIYAIEGDKCTTDSGVKSSQECYYSIRNMPLIRLQGGLIDATEFYQNAMIISISSSYNGSCSLNLKVA